MKTKLKNRTLWYDGTSEVNPNDVPSLILSGIPIDKISVTEINSDIQQVNYLIESDDPLANQLLIKKLNNEFSKEWKIPNSYKTLDLELFVQSKMHEFFKRKNITEQSHQSKYSHRVNSELVAIEKYQIDMTFRTIIYIIDKLSESNTLWGVGRGSSCASLVLFLLGLHAVDPIRYNIAMEEFFHD